MYIVIVNIQVKEEFVSQFIEATKENVANSIKEAGIARFDFIQHINEPTRFALIEVYRTEQDSGLHKETDHYKKWRDTVAPMMASERKSDKYINILPLDPGWG